jgi:hypothetical protein
VQPAVTTKYFVTATDANGCVRKDTVQVDVVEKVDLNWQHHINGDCDGLPSVLVQNLSPDVEDVMFSFDFGDGTTSQESQFEHVYKKEGEYSLKFHAQKKFCSFEETVQLPIYELLVPNVFTPEVSPGYNDNLAIQFGPDLVVPTDAGLKVQVIVTDRWGKKVFESQDYKNDWRAPGLASGVYFVHLEVGDLATCKTWLQIMK